MAASDERFESDEDAPSSAPRVARSPWTKKRPTSPLFRFLAINLLIGMALGQLALAGLVYIDAAGIGSLIQNASNPLLPLGILSVMFALTFGAAVTATAVLTMPYPSKDERDEG